MDDWSHSDKSYVSILIGGSPLPLPPDAIVPVAATEVSTVTDMAALDKLYRTIDPPVGTNLTTAGVPETKEAERRRLIEEK